jgi:hypothetical protein
MIFNNPPLRINWKLPDLSLNINNNPAEWKLFHPRRQSEQ